MYTYVYLYTHTYTYDWLKTGQEDTAIVHDKNI